MNLLLIIVGGGTLRWISIPSERGTPTPIRFMLYGEERNSRTHAWLKCRFKVPHGGIIAYKATFFEVSKFVIAGHRSSCVNK